MPQLRLWCIVSYLPGLISGTTGILTGLAILGGLEEYWPNGHERIVDLREVTIKVVEIHKMIFCVFGHAGIQWMIFLFNPNSLRFKLLRDKFLDFFFENDNWINKLCNPCIHELTLFKLGVFNTWIQRVDVYSHQLARKQDF